MHNMCETLRVSEHATNEEIQTALHNLFNQSPQGNPNNQGPQGHSVLTEHPQGVISSMNEDSNPQVTVTKSIIAATAISRIQLDDEFKNYLLSALQSESPYSEILIELSRGVKQTGRNNLIFKRMNNLLFVHDQNQDSDLDFWRIIVPEKDEIKAQVIQEMHSSSYSTHPGIQRTIARVRRPSFWKGMLGDIRQFVENCPVCQTEKVWITH